MNVHPYFLDQIIADRHQALTEQADTHRLLEPRVGRRTLRRRIDLRRRFTRLVREHRPSAVGLQSTTAHQLPPS